MLLKCNKAHSHHEGFGIVIFQVITTPPQRILKTSFAAVNFAGEMLFDLYKKPCTAFEKSRIKIIKRYYRKSDYKTKNNFRGTKK